jgi:hypothetical protein
MAVLGGRKRASKLCLTFQLANSPKVSCRHAARVATVAMVLFWLGAGATGVPRWLRPLYDLPELLLQNWGFCRICTHLQLAAKAYNRKFSCKDNRVQSNPGDTVKHASHHQGTTTQHGPHGITRYP